MKIKLEAGFTLVELLTVVAIIGVLSGIVALNLAGEVKKNRLKEATTQFYSDLKKSRIDAMTNAGVESTRGFGFYFNNATSYTTFRFDDAPPGDYNFVISEAQSIQTTTLPHGVQVESSTLTAPLLFDRRGWVRSANWSSASGGTFILKLTDVPSRCVVLSTSQIRQGVWDDPNCNSN